MQFSAAIRGGLIEAMFCTLFAPMSVSFPPRFVAASLKRLGKGFAPRQREGFPPRFVAASLKRYGEYGPAAGAYWFSAAIRGGLIEATVREPCSGFRMSFSAAIRGGLIEAL